MTEGAKVFAGKGLLTGEVIEPTCRYGHGPLIAVERLRGHQLSFGLIAQRVDVLADAPGFTAGLRWMLCPTCGYSELFDANPADTLRHMGESQ